MNNMEVYENAEVVTGAEGPLAAADTTGVYESIAMLQNPGETRKEQATEANHGKTSSAMCKKAFVVTLVVVVLLAVSVTALVVSFLQPLNNRSSSSQDMQTLTSAQVMENEIERNKTSQLIESLQQELDNLKSRLRQSEGNMETLSATCESLGFSVAAINTSVAAINTTMQAVNNKVNENSQNISRYHPQDPKCLLSEYQQNPYSNTCYRVVKVNKNWTEARDYCTASGEYLATFVTADSVEWFASIRTANAWGVGSSTLWVGGYKYSSGWKWTGRVTVPFNSALWAPGEPNSPDSHDCMYSTIQYNRFWDYVCSFPLYFVCETA